MIGCPGMVQLDVFSYIDPGTVQSVFSGLAPILAAIGSAILFLLWPFRYLYHRARSRFVVLSRSRKVGVVSLLCVLAVGTLFAGFTATSRLVATAPVTPSIAPDPAKVMPVNSTAKRVIVLGMDGLDPKVIQVMIEEHELPHFAKLSQEGVFLPLATSRPPASPVAWSTIATGTLPGEHGVFDFLHRFPKNYLPYLSLRNASGGFLGTSYKPARKREGFWYYSSKAGLPTTVIRWPITFPAEKVNGRFLSGFGVPDLLGGEGQYTFYTSGEVDPNDPGLRYVSQVEWNEDRVHTKLQGPATGAGRFSNVALEIHRVADDRVEITIPGSAPLEASLDTWSEWLPVAFSVGLGRSVYGSCKFLLASVEPELRITASPIHMDPSRQAFPITWPATFGTELQSELGHFHTLGMPEQIQPLTHGRYGYDAFLAECSTVHNERVKMLRAELDRFDSGVLTFVFDTSDRIQHAFWVTRDPEHPAFDAEEAKRYKDVIPRAYRDMDSVLGEVMNRLDDDTALIVVSDHGFSSFRRSLHINRWLVDHGYMVLTEEGSEGEELFRNVDWTRTRAYAYGFTSVSINLRGRERKGIVSPGDEQEALCREISAGLLQWLDDETDLPVIHSVEETAKIYPGPATAKDGPDLILGLKPGYRVSWQTALGGAPLELIEDNTSRWSGDHLIDPSFVPGIFLSNRPVSLENPAQDDIAPSVLYLLGLDRPSHMTGRVLFP